MSNACSPLSLVPRSQGRWSERLRVALLRSPKFALLFFLIRRPLIVPSLEIPQFSIFSRNPHAVWQDIAFFTFHSFVTLIYVLSRCFSFVSTSPPSSPVLPFFFFCPHKIVGFQFFSFIRFFSRFSLSMTPSDPFILLHFSPPPSPFEKGSPFPLLLSLQGAVPFFFVSRSLCLFLDCWNLRFLLSALFFFILGPCPPERSELTSFFFRFLDHISLSPFCPFSHTFFFSPL